MTQIGENSTPLVPSSNAVPRLQCNPMLILSRSLSRLLVGQVVAVLRPVPVQRLEVRDLGNADSESLGDDVEKSCRGRGLIWLLSF